jgi:hypothetical protein
MSAAILLANPAPQPATASPPPDYRRLSHRLDPGMSEQEVTNLLGQPRQSVLTTCGQNVRNRWPCKIWSYGFPGLLGNSLSVIFAEDHSAGPWVVNEWE